MVIEIWCISLAIQASVCNQFSKLNLSTLCKSESLETKIKPRVIAVAAINTSASCISLPFTFKAA
jgi:hypothetical protein